MSFPRSVDIGAIAAALAWTTISIGALTAPTVAEAKSDKAYYTAKLVKPVTERTTTVAGGVAWVCQGSTCVAKKGSSRPLRICRAIQKEEGKISSFTAAGEKLDDDKLARCNR